MEILQGLAIFMVLAFVAIFGGAAAICAAFDRHQDKKRSRELERIIRKSMK